MQAPWISADSDHVLEENMVISIEPGLYPSDLEGLIVKKESLKAKLLGKAVKYSD
ncbi:MAG: hypothetical protein Q4C52_01320 [Eubacteriales bacterium]|nr:hypothetical protein [Eubacteriales bacterium]